ncbi:allophanate hydrolase [Ideonella azotifigens]|uniref:Allophanate hydrolase n=3 Tax=Ideonella azotifigens TaxID=513160 RepID=A0ABN1JZR9_9BURK|nr:allophanate hydrolase [Ideonella azotifigens]MCD2342630.1 allophanate hydrolase [Ideonella azotifigens]
MNPRQNLLTLEDWRSAYAAGAQPQALLGELLGRLSPTDPAWIARLDQAGLQTELARLATLDPAKAPLWGVPFAAKDNIDAAGWPTTAACPAAAYQPTADASVVARLRAAGAVLVGKTNLDQFATGLVGTRSPFGEVPNTFDADYVSGGSSSGSASVVARGIVPFALGTDTAGSGRVPAGFNNLVGWKPTPHRLGMQGVLPACKSLDVVSVFALTLGDAGEVAALIDGPDEGSPLPAPPLRPAWLPEKPRMGVPMLPELDTVLGYDAPWRQAEGRARALGAELVPLDFTPLFEVAALLYQGPWVAERYAAVRELIERSPEVMDPTVLEVISQARRFSAADAFDGRYKLEALARAIAPMWQKVDALMVPTAPTHPTLAEVAEQPVARNSALGRYTNFVNLLGMAALALPGGFTAAGLPFGVTWIAPGGADAALADWGRRWEQARLAEGDMVLGARLRLASPSDTMLRQLPASTPTLALAVVGAHLQGLPLHYQLRERGCRLLARTRSSPHYRLHALPGTVPPKPALARVGAGEAGHAIELEVYEMPLEQVGSLLALIPPPLGLGSVELEDGRWVKGFICEPAPLADAPDISEHGGWRAYLASRALAGTNT